MTRLFDLKSEPLNIDAKSERIYEEYPRHEGKAAALTAIRKALDSVPYEDLVASVVDYNRSCRATRREKRFIPLPATWFNQKRWLDDRINWYFGADDVESEAMYARLMTFVRKHGRDARVRNGSAEFAKAKQVARACSGGWTAFCDGKVSLKMFKAAWMEAK